MLYMGDGRVVEAPYSCEAVRVRPAKILPLMQLAQLLTPAQPAEAMETYRKVLAIDERFEAARIALAKLLALNGRLDEAIAECRRAIDVYPGGIQARTLMGDLYLNQGNTAAAAQAYRDALAIESVA